MSNSLPKAIRAPSRLERIVRLVKRMLAVAAALDSAEAMTLRDKRRILSAQLNAIHQETTGVAGQILDYPQRQNKVQQDSRTERLAS
ncbi:MAG: hypothetical protein BMS9Abin06_0781 [Gammaproteobacteria bacterium]|nr:MAG: hypothetical protein BMS9Abin06_0781 [Gammaproteobacteria bacterium]